MNTFQVTQIIDANTIRVEPKWQIKLKSGSIISGNRIKIRGLDSSENQEIIIDRLNKLLIGNNKEIQFNAPELIETENHEDAVVSCSVYLSHTNIMYYFPEFAFQ